jgi:LEA14-like dessication related protein
MARAAFALLLALTVAGCAGLGQRPQPPEVSVAGLGFGQPGLFEQELRVDLRLRNPNQFGLNFDSLSFNLELNDLHFARGRTSEAVALPAGGETVVPVSIAVPTGDLIERVMQLGVEQRLEYRLTGEAVPSGLFGIALPFAREGQLALPRLPGLG